MRKILPYLFLIGLLTGGCELFQDEILPEDGFTKIYNHPDEVLAFYPESVLELDEGGYIFVSAVKDETSEIEYPSTYVVRTSASGEVEWTMAYDWLAPCATMIQTGSGIAFVAMNQQFEAYAVSIDPASGAETGQYALDLTMPLAAYTAENDQLLVLGYDFVTRSSWISKFSSSFVLERSTLLPINTDLEYEVQRHLNRTGQEYPFFIGEYNTNEGAGYFVNCFYNYTLRTVFLDLASLGAEGSIFAFRIEEGISSLVHKNEGIFGLTSYFEGNNYILPDTELSLTSSQNIKDFDSEALYELTFKAPVEALILNSDTTDYELFVSQTNSNSLVIYQYAMDSDSLLSTIYKDFDETVEVKDLIQTGDGGIAILSSIRILGKYRRPLLVKIPAESFIPEE